MHAEILIAFCSMCFWADSRSNNLIVFLINEFNIKSVDAAQINNVFNGCVNLFPLIGAVVADSLLGCFSVIWISSLISLLGFTLLLLTVTLDGLSPPACSNLCTPPSTTQYAVLYSSLALVSIGIAGTRFTLATMGANQFTMQTQPPVHLFQLLSLQLVCCFFRIGHGHCVC